MRNKSRDKSDKNGKEQEEIIGKNNSKSRKSSKSKSVQL
jgi:hypothetical protein